MIRTHDKDVAVIIPARNEADRIEACLTALANQSPQRVTIVLVINNTTDDTAEVARRCSALHGLDLQIVECVLPANQGVGLARKIGCDHALHLMPNLNYLLTTDADCLVAPNWISRNVAQLKSIDAVCGKVKLIAAEAGVLSGMDVTFATHEGTYKQLVQDLYAKHAEGCGDIKGTHGEAAGASLALCKKSYIAVGGFETLKCGEDRQIIRVLRNSAHKVRHVDDVVVYASCRLLGRADGGMSDALKARISGADYLIDDSLADASWIVANVKAGTLGVWPPLVPPSRRVNVRDLPQNIALLQRFLNANPTAKLMNEVDGLSLKSSPCSDIRPCQLSG